jgi:hypothetical protein
MGGYISAVSGQRLGEYVPAATDTNAIEELRFLRVRSLGVINKGRGWSLVSSVRESVKRRLEPGGRGIAIVGIVTRKRQVTV